MRLRSALSVVVLFLASLAFATAAAPRSTLVNLSMRAAAGTGDATLIGGFVISGTQPRPILVRGAGPALRPALGDLALPNPRLTLFQGSAFLAENDDWSPGIASVLTGLGAAGFTAGSQDAALWHSLAPGLYSMHATSADTRRGEVVLELYDGAVLPGTPVTDSAIVNLSIRAVATADTPAIAGFGIAGTRPKHLLLRAVGPALAAVIPTHLPDPTLTLYSGSTAGDSNDNWSAAADQADLVDIMQAVGAGQFAAGSKDAALLVTLEPGNYTAHIRPAPGTPATGGVVLFEIYDADAFFEAPAPIEPPIVQPIVRPTVRLRVETRTTAEGSATPARLSVLPSIALSAPLEVQLALAGGAAAGADYVALPTTVTLPAGSAGVTLEVAALADGTYEATEAVEVSLMAGNGSYAIADTAPVALLITDHTPATGTGFAAEYFANRNLTGTPALTRTDATIDFDWGTAAAAEGLPVDNFSVRWRGSLLVPATGDYQFIVRADNGVRLWLDGTLALDTWATNIYTDISVVVPLVAGTRCTVRMEMFESGGSARAKLHWLPPGAIRHVVPAARILPGNPALPPVLVPPAVPLAGVVGIPFTHRLKTTGATSVTYRAAELPPGLTLDAGTGMLSGTPTTGGTFASVITATNAAGTGTLALSLRIAAPGGKLTCEQWSAPLTPASLDGVPVREPEARSEDAAALDAVWAAGTARYVRWRGTFVAPLTGVYRFHLAGSAGAELWLADSREPADAIRRAWLTTASGVRTWSQHATQVAAPLQLTAGESYFIDVRVPVSTAGGHVALGWVTPGAAADAVTLVPAAVFAPFDTSPAADGTTVYLATLRPMGGVLSPGSGVAVLTLDEASGQAQIAVQLSGVGSAVTNTQVYIGDEAGGTVGALLDLPMSKLSGYTWAMREARGLTVPELLSELREGRWFVIAQTTEHPTGELRGQFGLATATRQFVEPAAAPALPSGPVTAIDAARLLTQATFGPTEAEIARVQQMGIAAWIDEQLAFAPSLHRPFVDGRVAAGDVVNGKTRMEAWWDRALLAPDQLRQRVAFALSEIFVVSERGPHTQDGLIAFYDLLLRDAFGDFRTLLEDVTLSPQMANYLSMIRNRKPDPALGRYPDENYAREIMQLFTIGLHKLHPDGSLVLDSSGIPVTTYTQESITGLARAFTGWSYASDKDAPTYLSEAADWLRPLRPFDAEHDAGAKTLLDGVVLPAGGTTRADLTAVLDQLSAHANVGPFIARRLIQRLVTSNPSPGYIYRVARVFADDGAGRRGQLGAVVRAILTDYEARSLEAANAPTFGKVREPLLRFTHVWRAFRATAPSGLYRQWNPEARLGQAPLRAPTVFNFFTPDHVHPGALAAAGLAAPEMQIATENVVAHTANWVESFAWQKPDPAYPDRVSLNLTVETGLVMNIPALVDRLDLLLASGRMQPATRNLLLSTLPQIGTSNRVHMAIQLLLFSPDYTAQR